VKPSQEDQAEWAAVQKQHAFRRGKWVGTNAPHVGRDGPVHTIYISAFQGNFELEELDAEGTICAVCLPGGRGSAFGTTEEVVAQATELSIDDPWVVEVGLALARERGWKAIDSHWGRRNSLEVRIGHGQMFHVSASANRESILRHGLDWRRMGPATGVAGSRSPELPGIFLQESAHDDFFVRMAAFQTDIWGVLVDGRWIESGPSGWWFVAEPVEPERLKLLRSEYQAEGE